MFVNIPVKVPLLGVMDAEIDVRSLALEINVRSVTGFFGAGGKEIPNIGVIDGEVPEFLISAPEHIYLVIDLETGRITNWPSQDFLAKGIEKFMRKGAKYVPAV